MKKLIVFTFLCSILFPRELFLSTAEAFSVKSTQDSHYTNIENENNSLTALIFSFKSFAA